MDLLKGKVVDIFNCETYNESINIGSMIFKVFKFFRVTKESGMLILFARVGDKFYGGMRYNESMNEECLCAELANMILDGLFEPTKQIELHARLGRKVELLDKTLAITDYSINDTDVFGVTEIDEDNVPKASENNVSNLNS